MFNLMGNKTPIGNNKTIVVTRDYLVVKSWGGLKTEAMIPRAEIAAVSMPTAGNLQVLGHGGATLGNFAVTRPLPFITLAALQQKLQAPVAVAPVRFKNPFSR